MLTIKNKKSCQMRGILKEHYLFNVLYKSISDAMSNVSRLNVSS